MIISSLPIRETRRSGVLGRTIVAGALAALSVGGCAHGADTEGDAKVGHTEQALSFGPSRRAPARCASDAVRICHFAGKKNSAEIIEVSERALRAHLAHGDGLAPASVQTDSDCLVPQPPPKPVSVTATTGDDGEAQFVIPATNIRVVATVNDKNGMPLSGISLTLLAVGADYFIIGQDPRESPAYAPAFAEGSLLDARPGSAPTVRANVVMQLFHSTFPGGGLFSEGATIPEFVLNHFVSISEECLTEDEFRQLAFTQCVAGSVAPDSRLEAVLLIFDVDIFVLELAMVAKDIAECKSDAAVRATQLFQSAGAPLLRIRQYQPPLPLPGVPSVPLFMQNLGACGGACCLASGGSCLDVKDIQSCSTTNSYHNGVYCSAHPCGEADLAISPFAAPGPGPVEPGQPVQFQFYIRNDGPGLATNVSASVDLSAGLRNPTIGIYAPNDGFFPCSVVALVGGGFVAHCDVTALEPGTTATIHGSAVTTAPGREVAFAHVSAVQQDPDSFYNSAEARWVVECPADLAWDPAAQRCETCIPFTNGSFESASINPGGGLITALSVGDTRITGWTVRSGDIDYIGGYWKASNGLRSLDMCGFQTGSISQTFETVAGALYEVRFDLSGEPFSHPPQIKNLRVSAAGASVDYSFDSSASPNRASMIWSEQTFSFVATSGSTTLSFSGLDSSDAGPALDNVRVYGRCQGTAP